MSWRAAALTFLVCRSVSGEPLTLDRAISLSLAVSPDLRSLVLQQTAALDGYRWGFREYLPKVGLSFGQNENIVVNSADTRSLQVGVNVTQLVFDAGRLGRQRDLARLQMLAVRGDSQELREQIQDGVSSLFHQILVLQKKLEIQTEVVVLSERQRDITRLELSLGLSREVDLLDTEAQVASLKVSRNETERNLGESLARLAQLLGVETKGLEIAGEFDADYPGLELSEDSGRWLAEVLDTSKDLAQQRLDLRQRYFALLNQGLWYLPNVSLELAWSLTGGQLPLQTPAYSASLIFEFPSEVFPFRQKLDSGMTPGQSRSTGVSGSAGVLENVQGLASGASARAEYEVSRLKTDLARSTVQLTFEKTLSDYRLLVEKLSLQRAAVVLEVQKNALLAKQVELGEAKRLDYLQGETQLASDRIALIESVLQLRESERALERLLHRAPGTLAQVVCERVR